MSVPSSSPSPSTSIPSPSSSSLSLPTSQKSKSSRWRDKEQEASPSPSPSPSLSLSSLHSLFPPRVFDSFSLLFSLLENENKNENFFSPEDQKGFQIVKIPKSVEGMPTANESRFAAFMDRFRQSLTIPSVKTLKILQDKHDKNRHQHGHNIHSPSSLSSSLDFVSAEFLRLSGKKLPNFVSALDAKIYQDVLTNNFPLSSHSSSPSSFSPFVWNFLFHFLRSLHGQNPHERKVSQKSFLNTFRQFVNQNPNKNEKYFLISLVIRGIKEFHLEIEKHIATKVFLRVWEIMNMNTPRSDSDNIHQNDHFPLCSTLFLFCEQSFSANRIVQQDGELSLKSVIKSVSPPSLFSSILSEIESDDENHRIWSAKCISLISTTWGFSYVTPFINSLFSSTSHPFARHCAIRILSFIAKQKSSKSLQIVRMAMELAEKAINNYQHQNQNHSNQQHNNAVASANVSHSDYLLVSLCCKMITHFSRCVSLHSSSPSPSSSVSLVSFYHFDLVVKVLWRGLKSLRGKIFFDFLFSFVSLIPLMDTAYQNFYSNGMQNIIIRELQNNSLDDQMKKILLHTISILCQTKAMATAFVTNTLMEIFFSSFWVRRNAENLSLFSLIIDTLGELSLIGNLKIILEKLSETLRDESDNMRIVTCWAIKVILDKKIKYSNSAFTLALSEDNNSNNNLSRRLIEGTLFAFQKTEWKGTNDKDGENTKEKEDQNDNGNDHLSDEEEGEAHGKAKTARLSSFFNLNYFRHSAILIDSVVIVISLLSPSMLSSCIPNVISTLQWRIQHKSPRSRQMAATLIGKIAPYLVVLSPSASSSLSSNSNLTSPLSVLFTLLWEHLGEQYPIVLSAILLAMSEIISSILTSEKDKNAPLPLPLSPSDMVIRIVPILKNRHDGVQQSSLELLKLLLFHYSSTVSHVELLRIQSDLLEMLSSPRKIIRKNAAATFGLIAKTIGPHDVIDKLLNNLHLGVRQSRVTTTVAIAIVAEACKPFTVIPSLLAEFTVADDNVQRGVLKSLSFLFEYCQSMAIPYVHSLFSLLLFSFQDKDNSIRQSASYLLKHIQCALCHSVVPSITSQGQKIIFNSLWPNILETSPHVILSVIEAMDSFRLSIGVSTIISYVWCGLFHPSQKIRSIYWKIFHHFHGNSSHQLVQNYPKLCKIKTLKGKKEKERDTDTKKIQTKYEEHDDDDEQSQGNQNTKESAAEQYQHVEELMMFI